MDKYLLSNLRRGNFSKAANGIYLETDWNSKQYKNYYEWYYGKSIPRVINGTGEVIFLQDAYNTFGVGILKKTKDEKKICTLLVDEEYRKKGYSKLLVEECFKFLETEKPLITIAENKIDQYQSLINAFDWNLTGITDEYSTKELIFN